MLKCKTCKFYHICKGRLNETVSECVRYKSVKQTNFQRITVSEEKLAEYLAKNGTLRPCGYDMACNETCPHYKKCLNDNVPNDYEIFLAWLKQESE